MENKPRFTPGPGPDLNLNLNINLTDKIRQVQHCYL